VEYILIAGYLCSDKNERTVSMTSKYIEADCRKCDAPIVIPVYDWEPSGNNFCPPGKRKIFSEYPTLAQAMADVAASHWDDEMHLKVVTLKAYNKYHTGDDNA